MNSTESISTVATDGAELAVTVYGQIDRPVVVMHPSLGRPAADFSDLARRLVSAGYCAVGIDPRGVANSTRSDRPVALTDLAGDVATVIRSLGLERAHLLGHAHGNRVMRCTAATRPDVVRSCILLAAGGRVPPDAEARAALRRCFDTSLAIGERLAAIRTAFFAPGNDPSVWLDGWYADAMTRQHRAVAETPVDVWWSGGTARLLVVQGLQDRVAPPENGRQLLSERPGVELVEIDRAGHALLPEQPVAVADAVIGFLASCEAA